MCVWLWVGGCDGLSAHGPQHVEMDGVRENECTTNTPQPPPPHFSSPPTPPPTGRKSAFKSAAERDKHLQNQVKEVEAAATERGRQLEAARAERAAAAKQVGWGGCSVDGWVGGWQHRRRIFV